ncbi:methionine synthase reductase isoform X2 [Halyomorpha halys]|uniref:methionine synthase reductase isoform X2 n=1 Tax=Halyomorpha halys TaxID=286706 RepID=UPI0034D2AA0E
MCVLTNLYFSLDKDLNLPPLCTSHFSCVLTDINCDIDELENNFLKESTFPFAASCLSNVCVSSATVLSEGTDVKTTLEIMLDISDLNLTYLPGDTIGILPKNDEKEINVILNRLGLSGDVKYKLSVDETKKKKIPSYIPPVFSVKFLLQNCLDIRSVVKKALLRALVEHTFDPIEKRRIIELCCREGTGEYNEYILKQKTSIIDILQVFSSCRPPLSLLIEHIPRLQPRPYSIASSPLKDPNLLRVVFNVVHDIRNRRGVCSGWLFDMTLPLHDLNFKLSQVELSDNLKPVTIKIPVYLRKPTKFRIPENSSLPLIMIGPGTGVAPFLGFLEHRQQEISGPNRKNTENHIMFGCRHRNKDDIYRKKFLMMEEENLCLYHVSYSRDNDNNHPKYVQIQ